MLLKVLAWTSPLKVRLAGLVGTILLSQLFAVFQNPSTPPPSQMLAPWAVGMSAPIERKTAHAAIRENRPYFMAVGIKIVISIYYIKAVLSMDIWVF
jgi:hypothetical protein